MLKRFDAHETERMKQLEGVPLASFGRGKTPGKALLRIRVVSLLHERLSFWHSLERALGYCASALEGGFGFIQYFFHPNHRTTHDRIAETIVVAEPKSPSTKR